MPFAYKQLTISGATSGVEGTAKLIQEIKNTLVSDMGWVLTDDQTNRATTSHQLTLQSNGEAGTHATFYLLLTSGTGASAAAGQDVISVKAATAWDTVTHRIPASGVGAPNAAAASGTITLVTDSNANYQAWISGDKDGVVLVTSGGGTFDGAYVGRAYQFTNPNIDTFPILVVGAGTSVESLLSSTTNVYSFLTGSGILDSNEVDSLGLYNAPLDTAQTPQNIFGSTESYVAMPIFTAISDSNPVRRSIRGVLPNMWSIIGKSGSTATYIVGDEIAASDGKVYQIFFDGTGGGRSLLIRKS